MDAAFFFLPLPMQISSLPSLGIQALQSLLNGLTAEIGPQGCAAAPVAPPASALQDFEKKFSIDFELWFSPSAQRSADMKGMIIVVGEHHYDPAIQSMVKRVMMGFRKSRGDQFFIEGGERQVCAERVLKYLMESSDCRLLETDSPVYSRLASQRDDALRRLGLCIDYLQTHVPAAHEGPDAKNVLAYTQFIQRHAAQLPLKAIPGFNTLTSAANDALDLAEKRIGDLKPERDKHMAATIRSERSLSARNYVVVGACHVAGLRERLADLPCVFMLPRQMVAQDPSLRPPATARPEL